MYSPPYALVTDRKIIDEVITTYPFATIIYVDKGVPQSFHLPLILENNKLIGHMAKANLAWKVLDHEKVLVVFHGPHGYISPAWYGTPYNVPTWNYISIQVRGDVSIFQDEIFLRKAMNLLGKKYDPSQDMDKNIEDSLKLLEAIVGIEISMDEILAKFKLAQSKSRDERLSVIEELQKSSHTQDHDLAQAMRKI